MTFTRVRINTQNPKGIFNIDGGKDNPTMGTGHTSAQQLNDFIVLANGNVGIGTTALTQKLENSNRNNCHNSCYRLQISRWKPSNGICINY